jgi:LPPG:FO 2-phospho-L-lactate transferase
MRRNDLTIALLAGGVGGARAARAISAAIEPQNLSIIANIGDDDELYGLRISPDIDSIVYTLAGLQGPQGWGRKSDTFSAMSVLADLGVDTTFQLGDLDLAVNLHRTMRLRDGDLLSAITSSIATALGLDQSVIPASDDQVPTMVEIDSGEISFQDYFVMRQAKPSIKSLRFSDAENAKPGPGVIEAIDSSDLVVIAPSNPPLSIWPILAVPGIREAVERADLVVAISPLVGGKPVKGPTDRVMRDLGYEVSHSGVAAFYQGLISHMVVDDHGPGAEEIEMIAGNTMMNTMELGSRFGEWFVNLW